MNEKIFIAGAKNSLCEQISLFCEEKENKVFYLKDGAENGWNKASPISSRTNVLQVKNLFGEINKAILIFDSRDFMKFLNFDVESISKAFDSMILGYSYLTAELLKLFSDQDFGELVFLLVDDENREKSPLEKMGVASFLALGEGIAFNKASKQLGVSLVKASVNTFENNVEWFFSYLENTNSKKGATLPKYACRWIKEGSKPSFMPFIK